MLCSEPILNKVSTMIWFSKLLYFFFYKVMGKIVFACSINYYTVKALFVDVLNEPVNKWQDS